MKLLAVGSQGGLDAAKRGECDVAPIHLLDPDSGVYNEPFLSDDLRLIPGYRRMQGVVTRSDETRDIDELLADPALRMVNRNRGAGTRVLIDELLGERRPPGYPYEPRSHYAVAAAVCAEARRLGRHDRDCGRAGGLALRPLRAEHYDLVVPRSRWDEPAVVALRRLLEPGTALRDSLGRLGFDAVGSVRRAD